MKTTTRLKKSNINNDMSKLGVSIAKHGAESMVLVVKLVASEQEKNCQDAQVEQEKNWQEMHANCQYNPSKD